MNKTMLFLALFVANLITNAQSTNPSPYCNAAFDDMQGFPVDDHINSVSFGSLNNVTNSQYAAPHYVFYNNLAIPNFIKGNNYTLNVSFTTSGGCAYGVWIDFNRNNIFETNEKVAGTTGNDMLPVGTTSSINKLVQIPNTASIGNTRMRVRIVEDDNYNMVTTNILPCNASASAADVMDWGETEDYTINITATAPININYFNTSVTKESVKNIVGFSNAYNNLKYEFEKSTNNEKFTTFKSFDATKITTTTLEAIDYPTENGTLYYRFKVTDKDGSIYYSKTNSVNTSKHITEVYFTPNPASTQIKIQGLNNNFTTTYYISNTNGKIVQKGILNENKTIDVSVLNTGLYFISFSNSNTSVTQKLLIK